MNLTTDAKRAFLDIAGPRLAELKERDLSLNERVLRLILLRAICSEILDVPPKRHWCPWC